MGILGFPRDAWVIGDLSVQFIAVYITTVDELCVGEETIQSANGLC